jgi:2-C-methyl-D-erythritol 4-phosphate cytidylyltransferase
MEKFAVIVAGGSGIRMGSSTPKQFLLLNGKPVLWHTINTFLEAYDDMQLILVLPGQYLDTGAAMVAMTKDPGRIQITAGGETRFHSVKNGLALVPDNAVVFVHDAVRCLISESLIHRCYLQVLEKGNAVPAITAVDSMRIIKAEVNEPIDRNRLRIIQTPQTFHANIIKKAFQQQYQESFTDEASVVERMGEKIYLVEGEESNIKITRPIDLVIAEKILEDRKFNERSIQ